MNRFLSKLGIGAATVETVFPEPSVQTGESVDVAVEIEGGTAEQTFDGIYFVLGAEYATPGGTKTERIESVTVDVSRPIPPAETQSLPATPTIPRHTPITAFRGTTIEETTVWLETGLEIPRGRNVTRRVELVVRPGGCVQRLFEALDRLGFRHVDVECWTAPSNELRVDEQVVQTVAFQPSGAPFAGEMQTLEVTLLPLEDEYRVYLAVDRETDRASAKLQADDQGEYISIQNRDMQGLRKRLRGVLREYADDGRSVTDVIDEHYY
jgi:sporulation-control protein